VGITPEGYAQGQNGQKNEPTAVIHLEAFPGKIGLVKSGFLQFTDFT
jgi:hypothetical protein